MTKAGMVAAQQHAQLLPDFASPGEAQQALFSRRDRLLNMLQQAATRNLIFHFDLSPDSLKGLETWYFDLLESDGFRSLDLDRETFEHCISMYVGQVVVQNHPEFRWVVEEYSFQKGKYEIGVRGPMLAWMLTRRIDLGARRNNSRRQSLWRDYCQRAG